MRGNQTEKKKETRFMIRGCNFGVEIYCEWNRANSELYVHTYIKKITF